MYVGFLTAWEPQESWVSYTAPQGNECSRSQDKAALPFMASSQVLQPRFSLCPTRHRQVSEIGPDSKEGDVYLL